MSDFSSSSSTSAAAFESAYSALNEEQKKAVDSIDGPMMVLAGPGTGKTQILALRIARILKETQMEPRNILCLTFTESGVAAMRRRLTAFLGEAAYGVRIHTFHSFCNDLIQSTPALFLASRDLEALTELERIQLLRELLDQLPEGDPLKPFAAPYTYQKDLGTAIQQLKAEDLKPVDFTQTLDALEEFLNRNAETLEQFTSIHGTKLTEADVLAVHALFENSRYAALNIGLEIDEKKSRTAYKNRIKDFVEDSRTLIPKQRSVCKIYAQYQKALAERGRYDFEDMILQVLAKMKTEPLWRARLQEQFQYILVDEYQDTNGSQNQLINALTGEDPNPNCFVVGDDKQSIYRFQGASIENMLLFYQRYKKYAQLITLQDNYRSQQFILDNATALIRHNTWGLENLIPAEAQKLQTQTAHPALPLSIQEAQTPEEETQAVVEAVQARLSEGSEASEIAILVRNNKDAETLALTLEKNKIPVQVHVRKNILETPLLKNCRSLLRLVVNPEDELALFRILHADFLEFETLEALKLTRAWTEAQSRQRAQGGAALSFLEFAKDSTHFAHFAELILNWRAQQENLLLPELLEHIFAESGILAFVLKQPTRAESLLALNTFFDHLKQWARQNPKSTLKDFLDTLDLMEENGISLNAPELRSSKKAVNIMTAHRSKGLEFEHVFIPHMVDKHWGNVANRSKLKWPAGILATADLTASERNEEERRLFYVALTRAKKTLTLTWSKLSSTGKDQVSSQFLMELSQTQLQRQTVELQTPIETRWELQLTPHRRTSSESEREFVKTLLQGYQLSVTHLNNYLKCPLKFYYENLLRIPRAKSKSEAFGTAIHSALYEVFLKRNQNGNATEPLALSEFQAFACAAFDRSLAHELVQAKDREALLQFGHQTLTDYLAHYADELRATQSSLLEYNFKAHNVQVQGVPLTGKLDKIEILDPVARTVKVVDYKTGAPDTKAKELRPGGDYHRQLVFYQVLCEASKEFGYKMVLGEIDFVQKGRKEGNFHRHDFQISESEKADFLTQLTATYKDIQDLRFLEPHPDECCGECEACVLLKKP